MPRTLKTVCGVIALVVVPIAVSALFVGSTQYTVFSAATLSANTTRGDTVVVSTVGRAQKPDEYLISLGGTTQAIATDSMFYTVVKAIRDGHLQQIGEDSLMIRPGNPTSAGANTGEQRVIRWVSDSLAFFTTNPMVGSTVTSADLKLESRRTSQ